jgi:hypothetical protein
MQLNGLAELKSKVEQLNNLLGEAMQIAKQIDGMKLTVEPKVIKQSQRG